MSHSGSVRQQSGPPPIPENEAERLAAVERYRLEGIGREAAFDRLSALAAELFEVPMALVTIIGADTQCMRGASGVDLLSTPREDAFCAFTILGDELLVVPDARLDDRFRCNPYVSAEPHIRFYAGAPLVVEGGFAVGSLCLLDIQPRPFDEAEQQRLQALARSVIDLIEMRVERFVAERQRQAVREERERLSAAIGHLEEGVALFDAQRRLLLWNEAFAALLGCPQDQLQVGQSDRRLFGALAPIGSFADAEVDAMIARLIAPESKVAHLELTRTDEHVLQARQQQIAGGQYVLTLRDVTADRQAARLKDELVSTVSHELRTPLAAISGTLDLLKAGAAGQLPDKAQQLVGIAGKNAERLNLLVDDLLDIDKLESGRTRFTFVSCDLPQLLRDAVAQNRPFAQKLAVEIELALPEEAVTASADRLRLLQVLTNLLSNAIKFSPVGGTVRLSLECAEGQAAIRVVDQGTGVPAAFRPRLFQRFAQAEGAKPAGHQGTGLGLAISKAIIDEHGGTIALEEGEGPGATFIVRLPLGDGALEGDET